MLKQFFSFYIFIIYSLGANSQTIGSKVSFAAIDGKTYTGIIKEIQGNQYKIKYDGFDFEAWLTNTQFYIVNTNKPYVSNKSQTIQEKSSTTTVNDDIYTIFNFGQSLGWASQIQKDKLNSYLEKVSPADKGKLVQFLNQAKTSSAKFFVLKSLIAGDNTPTLQKFINQLNQFPESYQQDKCLITNNRFIIQQWEFSCSVTTVQTYLADLCPRYAWEVKQLSNYDVAANDPYNSPMGIQQKALLEKYGGVASVRGDFSGRSIAINDVLNEWIGPILGVTFYHQQVTEPLQMVFAKIRNILDKGIDEPLLIKFVGTQARHFILVMKYRNTASGYQYLIYDPWEGISDFVNEYTIIQGSLAPLLSQWRISIDYYYPVK